MHHELRDVGLPPSLLEPHPSQVMLELLPSKKINENIAVEEVAIRTPGSGPSGW